MFSAQIQRVLAQPTHILSKSRCSTMVCVEYLDFVTNTMEYCRGFVQMTLCRLDTQRFVRFQRILHNHFAIKNRLLQ